METTLSALLGSVSGARGPPTTAAAPEGGFFGSFMFDRPGWESSIKGSESRNRNSINNNKCLQQYRHKANEGRRRWKRVTRTGFHTWVFLRRLHTIVWSLLIVVRVGRGRIGRELVLSLHCDRYITALQVPEGKEMLLSTRTLLVCYLRGHSSSTCQLLPNNTVQAADLLVGVNSVVFAWEVLQAACSTVSDRQGRVLGPQYRTLLRMCCATKKGRKTMSTAFVL